MKLLRLDLIAFGPFAEAPPLLLGDGDRGLHLIHGPNEAGKSSTLRALRALLFDYPTRTTDAHRHKFPDLRLGATLRAESGAELGFVRRKRNVQPLWSADDLAPLPDDVLRPFLDGLDAKRFDDLFSMNHAELVEGGRQVASGGGDLGSILFAAGTGLTRLHAIRATIDGEMDDLFKERGKNPKINLGLAQWDEARAAVRKASTPTESWLEAQAEHTRAEEARAAVAADCLGLAAEAKRLESVRLALPLIARRDQAARAVAEVRDVPILADGFASRRVEAEKARAASLRAGQDADRLIAARRDELDRLGLPDPALAEAEAIRRVRDGLPLDLQARDDRPAAVARIDRLEQEARSLRAALGLDDGSDPARVPQAQVEVIQGLALDQARFEAQAKKAAGRLATLVRTDPGDLPPRRPHAGRRPRKGGRSRPEGGRSGGPTGRRPRRADRGRGASGGRSSGPHPVVGHARRPGGDGGPRVGEARPL